MAIILNFRRRCSDFPSAVVREPEFGELAVPGRPFSNIFRRPGVPLPHLSLRRRFPRPTLARAFVGLPGLTRSGHRTRKRIIKWFADYFMPFFT